MKRIRGTAAILALLITAACNNSGKSDKEAKMDDTKMEDTAGKMDKMDGGEMKKEDGVMVGGAMMVASKDIVDNAAGSA
ncbi:MAG TPA: hypothetical protein PLA61_14225, partial [Ferruginibacter sp.]|nr:hypothetical protein [Ferruginibacter sp.]